MSRRDRQAEHNRRDIIAAAAKVFSRQGFATATMNDVAKEAGYTAPALYSYFASKKEMVDELVQQLLLDIRETFDEVDVPGLSFEQRLQMLVTRHLTFADKNREAFRLLMGLREGGELCAQGLGDPRMMAQLVVEWLRRNATEQDVGGRDLEEAAFLLMGVSKGVLMRFIERDDVRLADLAPKIIEFFLYGIRGQSPQGVMS